MQRKMNEHAFDPAIDAQAARASELALLADALESPVRTFPEASRRDLCGEAFENADIGAAFDAARALFAEGLAVDAATVLERLSADRETAAAATVEEATRGVPLPCHAAAHVEAIRRRATLRRVASLGMRLAADAGNRKGAPDALLSQAADEIAAMQRSQRGDRTAADESRAALPCRRRKCRASTAALWNRACTSWRRKRPPESPLSRGPSPETAPCPGGASCGASLTWNRVGCLNATCARSVSSPSPGCTTAA